MLNSESVSPADILGSPAVVILETAGCLHWPGVFDFPPVVLDDDPDKPPAPPLALNDVGCVSVGASPADILGSPAVFILETAGCLHWPGVFHFPPVVLDDDPDEPPALPLALNDVGCVSVVPSESRRA